MMRLGSGFSINMKSTLYKYFPLNNDKDLSRVIECIRGKIHFSSPITFNDPFELQTTVSPPNRNELHDFFNESGFPIDEKPKSFKNKLSQSINNEFLRSPPTIASREWLGEIGILCLTENPKNLLMWAHYGSNHKGVCLGFDTGERPFSTSKPLTYTDERPQIPFSSYKNMEPEDASKIFLHKSKEWDYESEWRCVKRTIRDEEKKYYSTIIESEPNKLDEIADLLTEQGGPGNYDFDRRVINRIYFGCRVRDDDKSKILNEVKKSDIYAKIFQLKIDPRHFQLIEDRIKR